MGADAGWVFCDTDAEYIDIPRFDARELPPPMSYTTDRGLSKRSPLKMGFTAFVFLLPRRDFPSVSANRTGTTSHVYECMSPGPLTGWIVIEWDLIRNPHISPSVTGRPVFPWVGERANVELVRSGKQI